MKICKNWNQENTIYTLDEWFSKCPPQGKEKHWVNGRSAKETAKHWLYIIPNEFRDILKCFQLKYELCSPEYVTEFDNYNNGRNHDLLIIAKDQKKEKVVVSVESKVDEPFDKTIGSYLRIIERMIKNGEATNAGLRIKKLKEAIFPTINQTVFKLLRYQLLTAVAGTLVEAKNQKAKKAIFLVQPFVSSNMDSKKHRQNQRDLDYFMEVISKGKHCIIHDNDLFGPFKFNGNEFIPNDVELWIGKYSIEIWIIL